MIQKTKSRFHYFNSQFDEKLSWRCIQSFRMRLGKCQVCTVFGANISGATSDFRSNEFSVVKVHLFFCCSITCAPPFGRFGESYFNHFETFRILLIWSSREISRMISFMRHEIRNGFNQRINRNWMRIICERNSFKYEFHAMLTILHKNDFIIYMVDTNHLIVHTMYYYYAFGIEADMKIFRF